MMVFSSRSARPNTRSLPSFLYRTTMGFSAGFIAFHFNMKRRRKNMPALCPLEIIQDHSRSLRLEKTSEKWQFSSGIRTTFSPNPAGRTILYGRCISMLYRDRSFSCISKTNKNRAKCIPNASQSGNEPRCEILPYKCEVVTHKCANGP